MSGLELGTSMVFHVFFYVDTTSAGKSAHEWNEQSE